MQRKPQIRWTRNQQKLLSTAVRVFNSTITRLEKQLPENKKGALPERVKVSDLKELISTRQDLIREVNALNRFTHDKRLQEIVPIPDNKHNTETTRWQLNETRRRVAKINRGRQKMFEIIQETLVTEKGNKTGFKINDTGMGSIDVNSLKPIEPFTWGQNRRDINKRYRQIRRESDSRYWDKKQIAMKENFIRTLNENYNPAEVADIVDVIRDMDFGDFYDKWLAERMSFEYGYPMDKETHDKMLSRLKAIWIPNEGIG